MSTYSDDDNPHRHLAVEDQLGPIDVPVPEPRKLTPREYLVASHLLTADHTKFSDKHFPARTSDRYELGHSLNNDLQADVNAQGGEYGSALQAAAANRETEVVKVLLENGADANVQAGEYGSALQAAAAAAAATSSSGVKVVKMLLENGADVNTPGWATWECSPSSSSSNNILCAESEWEGVYIEFMVGEHPTIPHHCEHFLRFSSKVSGSSTARPYIAQDCKEMAG